MGPVIEAIDEGHFEKTVGSGKTAKQVCRVCLTPWECEVIKFAKIQQREYAEKLAREQRTMKDATRVEAPRYNPGMMLG